MKVMIVVTHLLGTGHLTRALTLAQAFHDAGHAPVVVSGGVWPGHLAPPAFDVVHLPAVRSDGVDFARLLDGRGEVVTQGFLADRQGKLLQILDEIRPDALITELFPFGRRILKAEFMALLEATKALPVRPQVFASIRDILAPPSKPAKADFADEMIAAYYDAVLVHSDPALTPLDKSWPVSEALAGKLRYTGFVSPPPSGPHPEAAGLGEILVTAGGGSVGAALFDCARAAAALDRENQWRVLIGGQDAAQRCAALLDGATGNFHAEPARPDFRQMLHHAAASVSFCGYNTALDVLQAPCPAVFVPFDAGSEVEQTIRASALAEAPGLDLLVSQDLTPEALLAKIAHVRAEGRGVAERLMADGAARTVEIVSQRLERSHGS